MTLPPSKESDKPPPAWVYVAIASLAIVLVVYGAQAPPAPSQQTSTNTTSTMTSNSLGSTTSTTSIGGSTITTTTSSGSGLYSISASQLASLESHFTSKYNPAIGLIAAGTQTSGVGGAQFQFENGTDAPIVPPWQRYLPNENWAVAAAFEGLEYQTSMAQTIFASIQSLESSVGWQPASNRESQWGYIVSYDKQNNNIVFTTPSGRNLQMPNGTPYQIDQAARWDFATQSWIPPCVSTSCMQNAVGLGYIDETMYQALNFYLRGDTTDAMTNLQAVANTAVLNSDGSVGFGIAPYRGMYLGVFVECVEVIGMPHLPNGVTMQGIVDTITGLQATQSDDGVPRQYNDFGRGILNSDDETTNAALLAFSPGVIAHIQEVAASGIYNLQSVPSTDPNIGI